MIAIPKQECFIDRALITLTKNFVNKSIVEYLHICYHKISTYSRLFRYLPNAFRIIHNSQMSSWNVLTRRGISYDQNSLSDKLYHMCGNISDICIINKQNHWSCEMHGVGCMLLIAWSQFWSSGTANACICVSVCVSIKSLSARHRIHH